MYFSTVVAVTKIRVNVVTGSIKLIADFVRKHRTVCATLLQLRQHRVTGCCNSNTSNRGCGTNNSECITVISEAHVYMKNALMRDEDVDDSCDSYIKIGMLIW